MASNLDTYEIRNNQPSAEAEFDIDIKKDDDKMLAEKLNLRLAEAKPLHDAIIKEVSENVSIFEGKLEELAGSKLAKYNSKAIYNRLFLLTRNLVGMDTDNMPIVDMIPAKDTPQSIKKAGKIKACMEYGMLRVKFLELMTMCLLDSRMKRDSFLYWFWNYDKNDFDAEPARIEDITISAEATNIQEAEYMFYHPLKGRKFYRENYPKQYKDIKFEKITPTEAGFVYGNESDKVGRGNVARLFMYCENDLTISMVRGIDGQDIILEKKQNPYYEYRDPLVQFSDWARAERPDAVAAAEASGVDVKELLDPAEVEAFQPIVNFLPEPRKPFIQIPSFKRMGVFYSENLFKQAKEALLSYNNKKRQISDNLRGANKKIVVDSNSIGEEERASITDEPLQVIFADMQANAKPVYYLEAQSPEIAGLMQDIQHDEQYFDDLFGNHEISRGSGNANTLGQDSMNFESDRTPVRMQTRAVEGAIKELFEGWIQLIKMFYTEKHFVKKFGSKEGIEVMELMSHDVEEGIEPIIKPGSMTKVDKASRAVQLFQAGAYDPYSLFVDLEVPNPELQAKRLINWLQAGQITEEDPDQVQADMQPQNTTPGDMTENPIEAANSENRAMQQGQEVPPTAKELLTKEHVKLHYAFLKDPNKKMEEEAEDILAAHAEVDKAGLVELMKMQAMGMVGSDQNGAPMPDESTPNAPVDEDAPPAPEEAPQQIQERHLPKQAPSAQKGGGRAK